jgi:hypothetical protein
MLIKKPNSREEQTEKGAFSGKKEKAFIWIVLDIPQTANSQVSMLPASSVEAWNAL